MNIKNKKISTLSGIIIIVAWAIITLGGAFAFQYFTEFQTPITNVQPNFNSQNLDAETAGWKKYTNSEYGFSFEYPNDWTLNRGQASLWPGEKTAEFSVPLFNPKQKYFMENTDIEAPPIFVDIYNVSGWNKVKYDDSEYKEKIINGLRFFTMKSNMEVEYYINFTKNNQQKVLVLSGVGWPYLGNAPDIADKIISTFKFTK